jgi:hypothetical protein
MSVRRAEAAYMAALEEVARLCGTRAHGLKVVGKPPDPGSG